MTVAIEKMNSIHAKEWASFMKQEVDKESEQKPVPEFDSSEDYGKWLKNLSDKERTDFCDRMYF